MRLFSFPFFFLLAQTLQGIEGEVQCGNNNTVPSCFYCMFNPEANRPVDPENCDTSPDCMLDSSRCVPRPENPSTQNPVPPVDPSTPAITEASVNTQAPVLPQEVFLSRIKVNLKQPTQWSNEQFGFQVEVCNESFCCRSIDMLTQIWTGWAQPILFVSQLNNLGNCGDLTKYETLDVTVYKTTQGYHPDLMSVVITFEDGSLFREQEFSRSCNRLDRNCRPQPLRWNFPFLDIRENNPSGNRRSREEALPADQCPDVHKPYDHVCPKDNVKILRVKPQRERKICYYQRCNSYTEDISSIAIGQAGLGTGGYCMPRPQLRDQYEYCCDLERYFTYPGVDENGDWIARPPEDIKFPRCRVMIPHRI